MNFQIELLDIRALTHDTFALRFKKPDGYAFKAGQAVDFALQKDGWENEARPFTLTSLPNEPTLEFIIKSYPEHDGVTKQIASMQPGDFVKISEPWGAISYQGPGVFLAAGAGITPFIAILREQLAKRNDISGSTLVFANKFEYDIILREELDAMVGLNIVYTLSEQDAEGMEFGHISSELLLKHGIEFDARFYLCGPPPMEEAVEKMLEASGVDTSKIVKEG